MNNITDINDPEVHRAIAEKVCGWVFDTLPLSKNPSWNYPEGSPAEVAESDTTLFLDANAYAKAIDAARLKGWGMQIAQYTEGVPYSWMCWHKSGIPRSSTHYAEDLTSAIIAALYWIAQQIKP